ncbi:MAG: DUF4159 domain-containing protein [Bryobacterales bacterium]|nr:DUF4159 domain-containing protein [Bryobacterales bacterium]
MSGSRPRRARALLAAGAGLVACAGWLVAQRSYHGVQLPPESPWALLEPPGSGRPSEFVLARMAYTDRYADQDLEIRPWQIDTPAAERHFLQGLTRLSAIDARPNEAYVHPDDPDFPDHPFLYVVEAGHWDLTDSEVRNMREYLLRGGFIVFDDFHGSEEWEHFMGGMRRVFPELPIEDLPASDEVFHVLFDMENREQIPGAQMLLSGRLYERDGVVPHWRGIRDSDGRLMVLINHNMDLGDAWEHADWPEYPERYTAMSYRLAINYIIYAMTH